MSPRDQGVRSGRPITIEDLFALKILNDPQLSPDGARVVCTVTTGDVATNGYRSHLWIAPVDGRAPWQLTSAAGKDTTPRWSPNGAQVAFISDRSGEKQVWVIGVEGGEARQVTSGPLAPSELAWSPDSGWLAVVAKPQPKPGPDESDVRVISRLRYKLDGEGFWDGRWKQVLAVPAGGGEARQLTREECDHVNPAWSPDGRWVAYAANPDPNADLTNVTDIWVVAAEGEGVPRRLTGGIGPVSVPAWSPDGTRIAYAGHDNACRGATNSAVWVVSASGGDPVCLTREFDRSIGHHVISDVRAHPGAGGLTWAPDGSRISFLYADGANTQIASVAAAGGAVRQETQGDHELIGCSLDRRAIRAACIESDPLTPGEIVVQDLGPAAGPLRRITDLNGAFLRTLALSVPERFQVSSADGWRIEGWVLRPTGPGQRERVPTILEIHGGPHGAYGNGFFHEFQLLAASGYGVVYMNPRGSQGYGQAFTAGTRHDWGGKDYEDLMRGLDHAVGAYSWIDPDRLGVAGGSYGGFMTNWVVGHTQRFKAAVTMRSISNAYSQWGTSDLAYQKGFWEYPGDPWESPGFYLERSPITYVRQMRTPLLILHSESDLRCPIEQGEQLFIALKKQGTPTLFVRFPGESHDLSRNGQPKHRVERLRHILAWFGTYLASRPGAAEAGRAAHRRQAVAADE
ncbi:MAG TPA: S9 family peptidase [bacterium]|nr:S9 family peptidase [bacterium]